MKRCSLCKSMARIYCDSDRASLCWTCDAKVHSANFLVARHSRSLLCKLCQSPTPWSASGEKLCPSTAATCGTCCVEVISVQDDIQELVGGNNGETHHADEIGNQGVRRSSTPIPPAASSSSSEGVFNVLLKRKHHEDELDSSSTNVNNQTPSSTMPENSIGDETGSFHSRMSSLVGVAGDMKKVRDRSKISGAYMHARAPLVRSVKSRRTADFDLNLLATE